ncbi:MAG: DUF1840 domain-containing protein [Sideroxydans sp.]|nr:DUF1840 domain-containing protein [Sideroxydans sp.]
MLVTFTTEAYADITMFGEHAIPLLKMMGHSGTVPSAIRAEDVPNALSLLKSAIEAQKTTSPTSQKQGEEIVVSMANRSLPLISLLTAATKAGKHVSWK